MRAAWWVLAVGQFAFCPAISTVAGEPGRMRVPPSAFRAPRNDPAPEFQAEGAKAIFFDGPAWKGKPTRVFAWFGVPKMEPGQKVPAIVLVHGGGGTAFDAWVRLWVSRGYAAIAMDTCGCVPKGTYGNWQRHDAGGPPGWGGLDRADEPMEDQWPYHAVADVILAHSLLRSMPEVDAGRIGITGISWGGFLTCIVSGLDDRFRFAAPVYGCGFLAEDSAGAPELKKLGAKGERWLAIWDPSHYLKEGKMPKLWVTGTNDFAYPMDSLQKSYRLAGGSSTVCIRPRMPHGHNGPGENPAEIVAFADSIVGRGTPLPTIQGHGRDGDRVWARFRSESPIVRAELLYTEDEGAWKDRRWETAPAGLDPAAKTATATLPTKAKVYFVNLIDDHGRIVSTEHEETNAGPVEALPDTRLLTEKRDLSTAMLDGLHRFAERKIDESVATRAKFWKRDTSSREAYEKSIRANRESFRKVIGIADPRVPVTMERFGDDDRRGLVAENDVFRVEQVRWRVLEGVTGEGLLLEPKGKVLGNVIALPDADQTPEQVVGLAPGVASGSQFARRLAANGFRVVGPTLISRGVDFSGNPKIAMTNQPHREWIYRQAYQMGRHVIGYEVQKVLAAVDWIKAQAGPGSKIGVAGYGEGGLVAFYAAAADPRIDAALVSGYFGPRQRVWAEPIYRNVWGLLREFGDSEIATLIAPRGLVVEHSEGPRVEGPPAVPKGRRGGAAVGTLGTPALDDVLGEWQRLEALLPAGFQKRILVHGNGGAVRDFLGPAAVQDFALLLGVKSEMGQPEGSPTDRRKAFDPQERQRRQVKELEDHVQRLVRTSDAARNDFFLNYTTLIRTLAPRGERFRMFRVKEQSADVFARESEPFRKTLAEQVIGRIPDPVLPADPHSRRVYDTPRWTGYEVKLDVYPDVFAWGILLVPKDIKEGERRPVVVCQHGRNGLPKDVIEGDSSSYHNLAARLAERGFVVFAPHNLYRGEDRYRMLNRKGNPVKLSMFSFITAQHREILKWLGSLPFVDAGRIAFYGLSYGGETAVRVPPLLEGYCLSICSGDFNDWARKVASSDSDYSFMFTVEWEMPYFNMGSTFNYAELAYLIVPRPFMVERGHHDGVAPDEWVASEYAKVRWVYDNLGLADRTEIEFFNGGHTINGHGTFDFLHKHLNWPKPNVER